MVTVNAPLRLERAIEDVAQVEEPGEHGGRRERQEKWRETRPRSSDA